MAIRKLPSVEYLCECLGYDAETGALTWKIRPREHFRTKRAWSTFNSMYAGAPAGSVQKWSGGFYLTIRLCGRMTKAHRIAWKMVRGVDPLGVIDHADGDGLNNRIKNLRDCTPEQNSRNMRAKPGKLKGVKAHYGKWVARIRANKMTTHLGVFATEEEAHAAYCAAAVKHFGEFARFK